MSVILGIIGFFLGAFLWSTIFGSLFGTLPIQTNLKKAGIVKRVEWSKTLGAIFVASSILLIGSLLSDGFLIGSLIACVFMFFSIGRLRKEAAENARKKFAS